MSEITLHYAIVSALLSFAFAAGWVARGCGNRAAHDVIFLDEHTAIGFPAYMSLDDVLRILQATRQRVIGHFESAHAKGARHTPARHGTTHNAEQPDE